MGDNSTTPPPMVRSTMEIQIQARAIIPTASLARSASENPAPSLARSTSLVAKKGWSKLCRFVDIFLAKFLLTFLDMVTDQFNAMAFFTGFFGMALYQSNTYKGEYPVEDFGSHTLFGICTGLLVWLPGLVRLVIISVRRDQWRGVPCKVILKRLGSYGLLLFLWPYMAPIM